MPDIDLIRPYWAPMAIAKVRVQKAADELAAEHNLRSQWDGNTLRFERPGLNGEICVTHSELRLQARLGFLLKPLKNRLVNEIEDKFNRLFPESGQSTAPGPEGTPSRLRKRP